MYTDSRRLGRYYDIPNLCHMTIKHCKSLPLSYSVQMMSRDQHVSSLLEAGEFPKVLWNKAHIIKREAIAVATRSVNTFLLLVRWLADLFTLTVVVAVVGTMARVVRLVLERPAADVCGHGWTGLG
jgi:hypothetical protein